MYLYAIIILKTYMSIHIHSLFCVPYVMVTQFLLTSHSIQELEETV